MKNFSKNKKLNGVLNDILESLQEMGIEEVARYYKEFNNEIDYNIAIYGNLLIYYNDIRELYRRNGYTSLDKMSDNKVWDIYRRQVGYVTRALVG